MPRDDLTKHDLEKTLEAHAKAIELQILISQQQNKLLEQLSQCKEEIEKVNGHFTNGFRSELKEHTHDEVESVREVLKEVKIQLGELERRSWQQMWIWGGIVLFTLANAVMMVIGMLT